MLNPFLGQVLIVPYNFAPRGWAFCNGQILSISQNTALFALLGTTYGGDGKTTFALPNLQGRVPIHFGLGPGLSDYSLGDNGGSEAVALTTSQLPAHTHAAACFGRAGGATSPAGAAWAKSSAGDTPYAATSNTNMSSLATSQTGGGQPHENRQPSLVFNFIIALQGIFPTRP